MLNQISEYIGTRQSIDCVDLDNVALDIEDGIPTITIELPHGTHEHFSVNEFVVALRDALSVDFCNMINAKNAIEETNNFIADRENKLFDAFSTLRCESNSGIRVEASFEAADLHSEIVKLTQTLDNYRIDYSDHKTDFMESVGVERYFNAIHVYKAIAKCDAIF